MALNNNHDLMNLAATGDLESIQALLPTLTSAFINQQDADGKTALWKAVSGGHVSVAWRLLQSGADANVVDSSGRTAMWAAVESNSGVLIRMLTAHGADPFFAASHGGTALAYAQTEDKVTATGALKSLEIDDDDILQRGGELVCDMSGVAYQVVCQLGHGRLGTVYAVKCKELGQLSFASGPHKALQVIELSDTNSEDAPRRWDHIHKADVHQQLSYMQPSIGSVVRLLHSFECCSQDNSRPSAGSISSLNNSDIDSSGSSNGVSSRSYSCLVTEAWETDLERHTGFGLGTLSLRDLSSWAYQIARGLEEVHKSDVVHCGVSLDNVLVRGGGEEVCLAGLGLGLLRTYVRVKNASGYLLPKRSLATPPEVRRAIEDVASTVRRDIQEVERRKRLADVMQAALTERLADSKQDMWAYGILLLRLIGLQNKHFPGKDETSDTYCELLATPASMRKHFIDEARQRLHPSNGHEELVLASIIDTALGCLAPTPGPRFSASKAIATLIPMDMHMAELGKFTRDADLVALDVDGMETLFAVPFGSGYFGAVFHVKVRADNTRWVMKRIKRHEDAELMLDEIRVVSRLQSDYVVRYHAALYEGQAAGGVCHAFLMELMEEDMLAYLRDRPELQSLAGIEPTLAQLRRVAEILLDVAQGLQAIHTLTPAAVVHRDLHIRNVLINKAGRAKITDFGCARVQDLSITGQTDYPGFMAIVPPEATTPLAPYNDLKPSYDMYGLGLLVAQAVNRLYHVAGWEELQRRTRGPFALQARTQLTSGTFPAQQAGSLWASLISDCLQPTRDLRPSSADAVLVLQNILQHMP